jgi:hypothetical protein
VFGIGLVMELIMLVAVVSMPFMLLWLVDRFG